MDFSIETTFNTIKFIKKLVVMCKLSYNIRDN